MQTVSDITVKTYIGKWAVFKKYLPQLQDTAVFPNGFDGALANYADAAAKAFKANEACEQATEEAEDAFERARDVLAAYDDGVHAIAKAGKNTKILRDFQAFSAGFTNAEDPSKVRKAWQKFKKENPEFEKGREIKLDFGPKLDKFAAAFEKAMKVNELAKKLNNAVDGTYLGVNYFVQVYLRAVQDAPSMDPKAKVKFSEFLLDIQADKKGLH